MALLLNWQRSKPARKITTVPKRLRLDINSVTLAAGQDPRGMILAFFRYRWSARTDWPWHQRIIIDRITLDGEEA